MMIEDSAEMTALASSRGVNLARHAGLHLLIKIDQAVLLRSLVIAVAVGGLVTLMAV